MGSPVWEPEEAQWRAIGSTARDVRIGEVKYATVAELSHAMFTDEAVMAAIPGVLLRQMEAEVGFRPEHWNFEVSQPEWIFPEQTRWERALVRLRLRAEPEPEQKALARIEVRCKRKADGGLEEWL